jgi:hypothetical protein
VTLLNHEYIRLCENYTFNNNQIAAFKLIHFTGKAFISFQFEHYREYLIRKYEEDPEFFKISNQPISVREASKPNDIFWYNLKIPDSERNSNILYSWGVLIMLLVLCFAALLGIQFWKMALNAKGFGQTFKAKVISLALSSFMSLITTIINIILSFSMDLLSHIEKHKTKSKRL